MENERPDFFKYLHLRLKDNSGQDLKASIKESNYFITKAFSNKGKVLIHCQQGVSRSASLMIAYLMDKRGMNYHEALGIVKGKRRIVAPNKGFEFQLMGKLKEQRCCNLL